MVTLKEIDHKLNEFWKVAFSIAALFAFVWFGVYILFAGWKWLGDFSKQASTPATATEAKPMKEVASCSVDHRFERTEVYPIGLRADIALDSCSGKLCKTWSWEAKPGTNPWQEYNDLPICSDLPNTKR